MSESTLLSGEAIAASPAELGYQMPAEWARHFATWLAFPHHRTDFTGKLGAVAHAFAEIARVVAKGEKVRLLVRDEREGERASRLFDRAGVDMHQLDVIARDTNRSWLRDSLPLWVTRCNKPDDEKERSARVAVNFRFNGWARYRDHQLDDSAGQFVAEHFSPRRHVPRDKSDERIVLEGGSIDVDGQGTLLTTEECLIASRRARFVGGRQVAESVLRANLGVKKIIWLPDGIVGDDTSGHIDDFARFAPNNRILLCQEPRVDDENHRPLLAARNALNQATNAAGEPLEIVDLPMPEAVFYEGERLPASYANFYICNAAVLVPVFNDPRDRDALSIVQHCFADRPVVGIYARDLVVGLGTLHCSTMQEPF